MRTQVRPFFGKDHRFRTHHTRGLFADLVLKLVSGLGICRAT